jgi:hypothetical protein
MRNVSSTHIGDLSLQKAVVVGVGLQALVVEAHVNDLRNDSLHRCITVALGRVDIK